MSKVRGKVLSLMRAAVRAGKSRAAFSRDLKAQGIEYPTKQLREDWSTITDFVAKDGALVHVRRDSYPAEKTLVETDWDIEGEYMYKVKVTSRLSPDEPIKERFVNIVTDEPMTPAMIEQAVVDKWAEYEDYGAETIDTIQPWTAIHTNI